MAMNDQPHQQESSSPISAQAESGPSSPALVFARGIAGALLGAVVGYLVFGWLVRSGFYALALPGATIGLGAGLLSRGKSLPVAMVCTILAAVIGLVLEWRHFPFRADPSFTYFLAHLGELKVFTKFLYFVGLVFAFWFGRGR